MTTDEELLAAADALREAVLVAGNGSTGTAVADWVAAGDAPAATDVETPDVSVVAVDAADADASADIESPGALLSVAVVAVPQRPSAGERHLLTALESTVDTVIVTTGDAPELTTAVEAFVSMVRDAGFVNVDLADARTVFEPVAQAALGIGESPGGTPGEAVEEAIAALPPGVETDTASGVLVDLRGGPSMSVGDVNDAVTAVRERVGTEAHVIWGGKVDEALSEAVVVRLIAAGVDNVRAAPGDDCPRCDRGLFAYTLSGLPGLSCDTCGFGGVSTGRKKNSESS